MVDPGFPIEGGAKPLGGHQLLMQALFGENACENERIGSHWGGHVLAVPPRSTNAQDSCVVSISRLTMSHTKYDCSVRVKNLW